MANQLYGYNPSSGGRSIYGGGASNVYSSRSSVADIYLSADSSLSRYLSADRSSSLSDRGIGSPMLFSQSDALRFSSSSARIPGIGVTQTSWPGVDIGAASFDPLVSGIKRPSESLYHQTLLGAHNEFGQSEAWFSSNPLTKRLRYESASNLPIYPQRPGEKDCAHYMLTRTCKFGDSCKFDHPIWVPEGGIPDWKEVFGTDSEKLSGSILLYESKLVPLIATSESLPERPGEPDCPYFLKTQRCKFGLRCKFNHPEDKMVPLDSQENVGYSTLPERPSEPPCAFYVKTGKCKFGATCKFHHPKDIQLPSAGQDNGSDAHIETAISNDGNTGELKLTQPLFTPALLHNSKGLPIRLGEVDCPFYLKTGSCKYGATCRYNHPERYAINPPAAAIGPAIMAPPAAHLNIGVVNPAVSILQTIDPRLTQTTLGVASTIYPQRPGQLECDYYMKTGECKFGENCKFHHPIDRSAATLSTREAQQQNVKLTLAGLPRREGAVHCPYYMKTGTCKYGATCKFDHPPPGEVMAMATSQGTSTSVGGEGNQNETVQEQQQ
ncbi:Zinc finger CCCH domain-containing protein [Actinidia chinensis var. chinensis]|uniref:Zinc finger CCCH domain-containing protein n=1 Tax=Actinidia chinensis var. chinensis TaxID=1590841 RepID=A0A2R6PQD6_ACTCC|nr:Zinc finger CCCH domain-containing protein [Actinidia chinensis var. chinensis]